jgi:hypothetical protein
MNEQDPDLLADDNLDALRGRNPYPAMSERFRLTEELKNERYQNKLLTEKCRQLEEEGFQLAANQCHAGYGGEYGHHRCAEIDRLTKERDEARRLYCEEWAFTIELERGEASDPRDLANEKKWDCYKDNLQDLG